jgi:hypothetical protein
MQATNDIEQFDASTPTIFVRRMAQTISDIGLLELRVLAKPVGNTSDCLRRWLRDCVDEEMSRRHACRDNVEPGVWALPWHSWDDNELKCALITSYSWYDVTSDPDATGAVREILRAVITAAATRLGELHEAIQIARGKN